MVAGTLIEGLPHASQANGRRGPSAVKTSFLVRLNGAHRELSPPGCQMPTGQGCVVQTVETTVSWIDRIAEGGLSVLRDVDFGCAGRTPAGLRRRCACATYHRQGCIADTRHPHHHRPARVSAYSVGPR
jgi:hypothetical protein